MADIEFTYDYIPSRYQDLVQRYAVLYPLTRACRSRDEVGTQTLKLCDARRARLSALMATGWEPRSTRTGVTFARNCLPTFIHSEQRTVPCNMRRMCPFCYARWVRGVWERVDAACRNCPDAHLIGRVDKYKVPGLPTNPANQRTPEKHIRGWIAATLLNRPQVVSLMPTFGLFCQITVEPLTDCWQLQSRMLLLVPAAAETPDVLLDTHGYYKRLEKLKRREIVGVVAKACRYPVRLMRGDPEMTATILRAQVGFRMSEMYHGFRKSR